MNDRMKEAETSTYEAPAARARQRLAENLRDLTDVGQNMIKRSGRVGVGAVVGLGALGVIMMTLSLFRRTRRPLRIGGYLPPRTVHEPSFIGQAARTILLSILGVLASRVAQRLPLPESRSGLPAE